MREKRGRALTTRPENNSENSISSSADRRKSGTGSSSPGRCDRRNTTGDATFARVTQSPAPRTGFQRDAQMGIDPQIGTPIPDADVRENVTSSPKMERGSQKSQDSRAVELEQDIHGPAQVPAFPQLTRDGENPAASERRGNSGNLGN